MLGAQKLVALGIGVVLVVVVLVVIVLIVALTGRSPDATLIVQRGTVEVSDGETWVQAVDGQKLSLDSKVRTLDGEATILTEHLITQLGPDTEVSLASLQQKGTLEQAAGSTWNKVIGLATGQQAAVRSPTVVAMVRGTEFGVDAEGILVAEGVVEGRIDDDVFTIFAMQRLKLNGTIEDVDPAALLPRLQQTLELLRAARFRELNRHPAKVKLLLKIAGVTDPLEDVLARIDTGEIDHREIRKRSPVSVRELERAMLLTDAILEQQRLIADIDSTGGQAGEPTAGVLETGDAGATA